MADDAEQFPPDRELREMAAIALKETQLFRHVSRRLLVDIVEWRDLSTVGRGPEAVSREPVVLVVLEGPIRVSGGSERPIVLQRGTFLRYEPPFIEVQWRTASLEAVAEPLARVFLLEWKDLDDLPPMIVNALDPHELERLRRLEPSRDLPDEYDL